jgi:hypothetical protein
MYLLIVALLIGDEIRLHTLPTESKSDCETKRMLVTQNYTLDSRVQAATAVCRLVGGA